MPTGHPNIDFWEAIVPPASATLALVLSALGLTVGLAGFRRKSGTSVRGTFNSSPSLDCEHEYVTSVTLENLKDRALTIFAIYLRLGSNIFIKLIDFEDIPLIVPAYGTWQQKFDAIQFYLYQGNRIDLNPTFRSPKVEKRLVLSTTDGKYVVPAPIRIWTATEQYFRNLSTTNVETIRFEVGGKNVGWNVDYILHITEQSGKQTTISIHNDRHNLSYIKQFGFTPDSLESAEALNAFLQARKAAGMFPCDWQIEDVRSLREHYYAPYLQHSIQAHAKSGLRYSVFGRIRTILFNFKMRKKWRRMFLGKVQDKPDNQKAHE